jgi:hypothetical protein
VAWSFLFDGFVSEFRDKRDVTVMWKGTVGEVIEAGRPAEK